MKNVVLFIFIFLVLLFLSPILQGQVLEVRAGTTLAWNPTHGPAEGFNVAGTLRLTGGTAEAPIELPAGINVLAGGSLRIADCRLRGAIRVAEGAHSFVILRSTVRGGADLLRVGADSLRIVGGNMIWNEGPESEIFGRGRGGGGTVTTTTPAR